MKEQMMAVVQDRHNVYNFLAELFLTPIPTPGHEYTLRFLKAIDDFAYESELQDYKEGLRLLKNFKAVAACGNPENIQKDLAVDRTKLCRGIVKKGGITPPYEALYLMPKREWDQILDIVNFYRKAGLKVSEENLERMDYIGIELAFMAELCAQEYQALSNNQDEDYKAVLLLEKEFLNEHLLRWALHYCAEMIDQAQTEFFRGFGHLIRAFLQEEKELCAQ